LFVFQKYVRNKNFLGCYAWATIHCVLQVGSLQLVFRFIQLREMLVLRSMNHYLGDMWIVYLS